MTQLVSPTAAELDAWRVRYLAAHEVIAAVEQLLDLGIIGRGGKTVTVDAKLLDDVQDQFDAWRKLVEANTPTAWTVAHE